MRRYAGVLVMLALLGAGCGTRQSHEDVLAASSAGTVRQRVVGQGAGATAETTDVSDATAGGRAGSIPGRGRSVARQAGRDGQSAQREARSSAVTGALSSGSKSPIKLGNVGIYSGVAGAPFVGGPQAIRA